MGLFDFLKNTFLPSEEVSRQRRLDVFGTESKGTVGAVIIGGAAGLILAPAAIAAAGGPKAVASGIGSKISALPTSVKIGGAVAAPIVVGAITADPKVIPKSAAGVVNFEKNLFTFGQDPSLANAAKIGKENPLITGGVIAGGLLALRGALPPTLQAIGSARQTGAIKEQTDVIRNNQKISFTTPATDGSLLPTLPSGPVAGSIPEPLTPETQVIGTPVKSKTAKKRVLKPKSVERSQNIRVNVLNQQSYINAMA